MDGVFLGLAGRLLGISLGLCPQEISQSSPASPGKTPSIPPLLLGLTHSWPLGLQIFSLSLVHPQVEQFLWVGQL